MKKSEFIQLIIFCIEASSYGTRLILQKNTILIQNLMIVVSNGFNMMLSQQLRVIELSDITVISHSSAKKT